METKYCLRCSTEKSVSEFYKRKDTKCGLAAHCIECNKIATKKWYENNKEKALIVRKEWKENNKEKVRENNKIWSQNNKTKRLKNARLCRERNKEAYNERTRMWRNENPELVRELSKKYRDKTLSTPKGKIANRMRSSIYSAIKEMKSGRKWETLVGYGVDELKKHLEKQFLPGMSWENMGEWHIDHKIPQAAFNYEKPEDLDFKRCWSLNNLQPLWSQDNMSKNDKLNTPFQPALLLCERMVV